MTLYRAPEPGTVDASNLALVFDLDGVIVDVTKSYRQGYVDSISYFLGELGLAPESSRGLFSLEDVHLLKTHRDFNAPHTMLDFLVRMALRAVALNPGLRLNPENSGIGDWIREGLQDGRLDHWKSAIQQGLSSEQIAWVESKADRDHALELCHECYVGSDAVASVYGHKPSLKVSGLCGQDQLIMSSTRPAPACPLGVYTGRVYGEASFLIQRFEFFREVKDEHICTIDRGYKKPECSALEKLYDDLGAREMLYIGDVPADRAAALSFRRQNPEKRLWLAQVLATPETAYWSEAEFVASEPESVLDSLGI
jgi:phosphoglycolate phosphatase-like HAD superfamily hydrolase